MNGRTELLQGLRDEEALAIIGLGSRSTLAQGEVLFRLGTDADRLFVIERGRVALTLPMHVLDREQNVLVEERGAGQTLGWSALTPPHRFTLTATALVETEAVALPRTALFRYFDENPEVGYVVARNVASIIGQRLEVIQAMWLREMQRVVKLSYA
ncbi:MAG TPA: cyclic nucleotide-binding domain-containing protein [Vicinamibacterales bacterium]|nr:cyclic nucleotide-binding domain-containing protein [Vicinamibacterales bacterium]